MKRRWNEKKIFSALLIVAIRVLWYQWLDPCYISCSSSSNDDEGLDKSCVLFAKRNKVDLVKLFQQAGLPKLKALDRSSNSNNETEWFQNNRIILINGASDWEEKKGEYVDWKLLAQNSSKISSRSTMQQPKGHRNQLLQTAGLIATNEGASADSRKKD